MLHALQLRAEHLNGEGQPWANVDGWGQQADGVIGNVSLVVQFLIWCGFKTADHPNIHLLR